MDNLNAAPARNPLSGKQISSRCDAISLPNVKSNKGNAMKLLKSRPALRRALGGAALAALCAAAAMPARAQVSVTTQNYDNARTGSNPNETLLTPANVNTTLFGKLFTLPLNANVNSQVLYMPNLMMNGTGNAAVDGTVHNVIFASTSNNSDNSPSALYAFDADAAGPALWSVALPVSAQWMTAAPVIDPAANLIYIVIKTPNNNGATYIRVYDITSGKEKAGSPLLVDGTLIHVPGTGDGNVGGVVKFDSTHANDRAAPVLVNGVAYFGFAHNSDSFPYHGWLLGFKYDAAQAKIVNTAIFCTNPNGGEDGIWQGGKGIVADAAGNLYFTTGNGTFDANTKGISATTSYGMSIVKVSTPGLAVLDWFAPHDESSRSNGDLDVGNIGPLLIPNTSRVFMGNTKFGSSFLMDSQNLGKFNATTDQVVQRTDGMSSQVGQNSIAWESSSTIKYVYQWGSGNSLQQWRYDTTLGKFTTTGAAYKQSATAGTNGGAIVVTSNGQNNGILWAVSGGGGTTIYALDPNDVSKAPFWTSAQNSSRDSLPGTGKWQFPMVVNGKAYMPNNSASITVYGLLPVTVSGTLALQSVSPSAPAQTFTFQFRPASGGAAITKTASVTTSGAFSFTGIPAGKYTLWAKGGVYLGATTAVDATNGAVSNASLALIPGDTNGDNSIDSTDFGNLIGAYGSALNVSGSGYDPAIDLDGDGSIDSADFGILIGNFNTQGAN